ncbi:MAG: hypothetical protein AAGA46_10495 [Cyanobacteria bacterium P01_F01_bin.13]
MQQRLIFITDLPTELLNAVNVLLEKRCGLMDLVPINATYGQDYENE